MSFVIKHRRDTAADWLTSTYILAEGEIGVELDTNRFKMGDGVTHWNELDYFIPEADIEAKINAAIADMGGDGGTSLTEHINDLTPHPVYDNGPSLLLLYQNAKV